MTCPVRCPAAGEARNVTTAATSSVVPARPVRLSYVLSEQLKVLLASLSPYPGHLSNERRGDPPALPSVPRLWHRARYERGVAEPGLRRAAGRSRGAHRAVRPGPDGRARVRDRGGRGRCG